MLSQFGPASLDQGPLASPPCVMGETNPPVLNCLREVRRREDVSLRTMARRLQLTISEVKRQEDESFDPKLSTVMAWSEALEVPLAELLGSIETGVSQRLAWRAKLVRVMKTVRTLEKRAKRKERVRRLAAYLVEQLMAIMPELKDVQPWPSLGKANQPRLGRTLEQVVSTETLASTPDNQGGAAEDG